MRTNKYFGTDGVGSLVGEAIINPEFILKLVCKASKVLNKNFGEAKVLIGKDIRISGNSFESVLENGLSSARLFSLTSTFTAQEGIEISASHNLYYDNGAKFFLQKV